MKIQVRFTILSLIFSFTFNSNAQNFVTFSKSLQNEFSSYVIRTHGNEKLCESIVSFCIINNQNIWQEWWFIPAVVIAFILIAYSAHMLILRSKIAKVAEFNRKKVEEIETLREKTAADFYDELGHRLTRISLLTELVKRKLGFSFVELKPMLDQISENSVKLYEGTKDFIWAIDSKENTLYEVMIRLKDFGDELFCNSDIDFNVEGISDELHKVQLSMDSKRNIILIFKEGMSNSFKHSKGRNVSLTSNVISNEFEIVLEDDGNGFEVDKKYKGNGLKNIKQRATEMKAEIQITTKPGEGTKILLKGKVPANN